ncbi:hypothetical protein JCM10908_002887 [Rhodotorula pacifica]|uniref:uncharacterized protein n=1 Tax=Rhodotorula pacifica TaxID=1495444 RepID=UPI0031798CA1
MYRTAVTSLRLAAPRRAFHAAPAVAKDLNHKVGDTLVSGIEKAESAAETVKEAAKPVTDAASKLTGQAAAEGKKAGADLGAKVDKTKADVRAGAQKAKAEIEKP